ncbi:hypothetical protein ABTA40_19515, partial [Acinetobacter baumannii]
MNQAVSPHWQHAQQHLLTALRQWAPCSNLQGSNAAARAAVKQRKYKKARHKAGLSCFILKGSEVAT